MHFTRFPSNVSFLLALIYVLSMCIYLVTLDLRDSHTSDAAPEICFKTPVSWELWSFDTLSALFYLFFVSNFQDGPKILKVNSSESRLVIYLLMWNIIVYPLKLQHAPLLSGPVTSGSLIFTHSRPLVTGHFKLDEGETSGAEGPAFVLRHRNLNSHTADPMSPRETPNTGPSTSHLSTSECSSHNGVSI